MTPEFSLAGLLSVKTGHTEGADLAFVGAEASEEGMAAQVWKALLEEVYRLLPGVVLQFYRNDEIPAPAMAEPLQQQFSASLRCGDYVAQQPIDGARWGELKSIAGSEVDRPLAHEVIAQWRAIHGNNLCAALDRDVRPTPRGGAQIDAGLARLDAAAKALLGFNEFREGTAGRVFVDRHRHFSFGEWGDDPSQLKGEGGAGNGDEAGLRRGEQGLNK